MRKIFANLKYLGDVYLEQVLLDYDNEPSVFICNNENEKKYLFICTEIRGFQRWIASEVSLDTIVLLMEEKIDVLSAFITNTSVKYVLTLKNNRDILVSKTDYPSIEEEDKPESGVFIEEEDWGDGGKTYLLSIKKRIISEAINKYVLNQTLLRKKDNNYLDIYIEIVKSNIYEKFTDTVNWGKYEKLISQLKGIHYNSNEISSCNKFTPEKLEKDMVKPNSIDDSEDNELSFAA